MIYNFGEIPLAGTSSSPWMVLGDFSEVLHAGEQDGVGQMSQGRIHAFRAVVDELCTNGSRAQWTFLELWKRVAGETYTRDGQLAWKSEN